MENAIIKVRAVADYQFGRGVGAKLFPDNVAFEYLEELEGFASSIKTVNG